MMGVRWEAWGEDRGGEGTGNVGNDHWTEKVKREHDAIRGNRVRRSSSKIMPDG